MSNLTDADRAKLLALTELSGIGDKRALKLVEIAGGIDAVYESSINTFTDLHYVNESTYEGLQNLDDKIHQYVKRIKDARESGISLVTPLDDQYPDRLREHHSPLKLFLRGNEDLLNSPMMSFAGSRDANDEALEWTKDVSTSLVDEGYCIVSGGAFGVDVTAHRAALDAGGNTIIASPSGHDNPYPKAHEDLFKQIEENGLVISHRFPDQKPARGGFLYRNKTNSALGNAIVIAAASDDGGSMAQFETASDQGREVFVPAKEISAEPNDGLAKMQDADNVTMAGTAKTILQKRNSTEGQSSLDDW
ncbi:DNA-processing protein DprA [Natrinema sp. 1APR25-10V2]|uniref:DNA-processing protein DprA n=1 Tax=Natrinema sp. 1APR25-10V2 TaxID=2951081 RepID=UPI002875ABB8|nr:DNA-processing protein DprA [Natrinema sp. 1APR25-10V2]MDS0474357.1 DNA-protecting protein DprA [Natrinema sp. 1APR25-10V2]